MSTQGEMVVKFNGADVEFKFSGDITPRQMLAFRVKLPRALSAYQRTKRSKIVKPVTNPQSETSKQPVEGDKP